MYLKIHCDYCNQDYDVYERDMDVKTARQCPHCGSKIDREIWHELVIPAFKSAILMNGALMYDHVENHHPLFTASLVADHLFPVSSKSADEIRKVIEKHEKEC